MRYSSLAGLLFNLLLLGGVLRAAEVPKVGDPAPAFTLNGLDDSTVRLADFTTRGSVVLVVLRGWPGYQCPLCDRQVNEFIAARGAFAEAKTQVIFVYPGPAADLQSRAAEFRTMKGREWPAEYRYALDPDYAMVRAYGLRWDAPRETAYPSTFVIDASGMVRWAKVSHGHGDRAKAADVVGALKISAGR
ncbi:MAG: redoxin domain-containing protein [Verrucomicrobia bacterium]|nr:redoxin domain-containing protein [Verrucomicrobiota bacterium]